MAELLVRVRDVTHPDPALDRLQSKRGDVVVICPDGWSWGREELTNPDWRILIAPGLDPGALDTLARPAFADPADPTRLTASRACRLALDDPAMPAPLEHFLADDARRVPAHAIDRETLTRWMEATR